jgi:hypothetical protein
MIEDLLLRAVNGPLWEQQFVILSTDLKASAQTGHESLNDAISIGYLSIFRITIANKSNNIYCFSCLPTEFLAANILVLP